MLLSTRVDAQTLDEEYKRLFPLGSIVLRVNPPIEGANRIILKMIRAENPYSPDFAKHYLYYEAFLAQKRRGKLTVKSALEGREYAVFGSRVFLSEGRGTDFRVKYIISSNLKIVSKRNMDFVALSGVENTPVEVLVPPFLCEPTL